MTDELPGAGPAMDALVAEALGWEVMPGVSTRPTIAMGALEIWRKQHPDRWWIVNSPAAGIETFIVTLGNGLVGTVTAEAPTLEAAICYAILQATRQVEDAR